MDGRKTYLLLIAVLAVLTLIAFRVFGAAAWRLWNIPVLQPAFIDLRIITSGAESFALGLNPDLENPRDPAGRPFNLPAIWKLLFLIKLDQSDTYWLAGLLIGFFFLGLIIFPVRFDRSSAWLVALAAFSPPILLALERGNVDLFIFFLCALSLFTMAKLLPISASLLGLAAILKIYPLFSLTALLHLNKDRLFKIGAYVCAVFILYSAFALNNLRLVFSNTEKGADLSYGAGVLPLYLGQMTGSRSAMAFAAVLMYALAFLILLFSLYFVEHRGEKLSAHEMINLAAFRLGSGIYIGTFLLGSNWDYRLMFLLFTLPQLLEWSAKSSSARYTLAVTLVSFAYFWITLFLPLAYFLDEFANWLVFAGLLYLLLASSPDWIQLEIHAFFERRSRKMR